MTMLPDNLIAGQLEVEALERIGHDLTHERFERWMAQVHKIHHTNAAGTTDDNSQPILINGYEWDYARACLEGLHLLRHLPLSGESVRRGEARQRFLLVPEFIGPEAYQNLYKNGLPHATVVAPTYDGHLHDEVVNQRLSRGLLLSVMVLLQGLVPDALPA